VPVLPARGVPRLSSQSLRGRARRRLTGIAGVPPVPAGNSSKQQSSSASAVQCQSHRRGLYRGYPTSHCRDGRDAVSLGSRASRPSPPETASNNNHRPRWQYSASPTGATCTADIQPVTAGTGETPTARRRLTGIAGVSRPSPPETASNGNHRPRWQYSASPTGAGCAANIQPVTAVTGETPAIPVRQLI